MCLFPISVLYRWLFLAAFLICCAFARQPARAEVRFQETLKIGTVENVAPYIWRERGQLAGLDVDIVREAARHLDYRVEFVALPWKRLMVSLEHGLIDAAMPFFYRQERAVFGQYTNVPLRIAKFNIFVASGSGQPKRFEGFHQFHKKRLGKVRGLTVRSDFKFQVERNNIELVNLLSAEQGMKLLKRKRIDGFVHDTDGSRYVIHKMHLKDDVRMLSSPVNNGEGVFLVFSRKKFGPAVEAMSRKFDRVLNRMTQEGRLKSLMDQYIPK